MYVSLNGWATAREIIEHEGKLYFEVAEIGHCSVCRSRINHIEQVVLLKSLNVSYAHLLDRFPRDARTLWVGLSKPRPEMTNEEIKEFIKQQLDLPII